MDLNRLLIWFTAASALLLLYRAIQARRKGWATASFLVLLVTAATATARPGIGGYVGGGALGLFILLPLFGYRLLTRWTLEQKYGAAWRLASALRWLHPADGWWESPLLLRALALGGREAIAEAAAVLQQGGASRTGVGRLSVALLYRMNGQWEELRQWLESRLTAEELHSDANMGTLYLRSLGEVGETNALVAAYGPLSRARASEGSWLYRCTSRLMLFAFCGRKAPLARLLDGPLDPFPPAVKRFWLATADMALGDAEAARAALEEIRGACDPLTAAGVERRLAWPLPVAEEALTPESKEILDEAEGELEAEARYGDAPRFVRRRPFATFALIALNLVAFGLELALGGSTDIPTLARLGALVPAAVLDGEWWRALTALFLHYGAVHLAVNMVALLILGPFLEFAIGAVRYVAVYLVAGVGSMLAIVALARMGLHGNELVVGASGSVMGLVGATVAVLLVGWLHLLPSLSGRGRGRVGPGEAQSLPQPSPQPSPWQGEGAAARVASRRMAVLLFVIGFQVVFDLSTPEVSFTAHLSGAVFGFIAAGLVGRPHRSEA